MGEELDRASPDRQAIWVALKTLRQRPTVAGRTDEGVTVYEVRSVRLVLAPNASHFKRLVSCAKCARDVPGSPVLSAADLDRPPTPVFCDRCGRTLDHPRLEAPRPAAPPLEAPRLEAPPVVAEGAMAAERLAAVEAQLAEVLSRAPAPVENAGELQRLSEQVADLLRGQNAELSKISASMAQVRAEMRELGEANRALDQAQRELDRRMIELAAHTHAEIEERLARELVQVGTDLAAALTQGLEPLRSEIASLQRRADGSAARSELEAQRTELMEALHDVAHETLLSVAEPLRDLTKAREDFERRLESLQQRAQDDRRRVAMLKASADAGASKLHALEQKLQGAAAKRRPPKALLESLDRQLREAEERLGQL